MSRGVAPHAVRRRMNKETQMMLVPQGSIEALFEQQTNIRC